MYLTSSLGFDEFPAWSFFSINIRCTIFLIVLLFTINPYEGYTACVETTSYNSSISDSIDGDAANNPPTALTDKYKGYENLVVNGNILVNDFDPDGDSIILDTVAVQDPLYGSISIFSDGSFIYSPDSGFHGTDSITYLICDDGTPALCDTGHLIIIVIATPITNTTVTVDDHFAHFFNVPVINNVLCNDFDPEGDSQYASLISQPSHGFVVLNSDGSFIYTPDILFAGHVQFVYTACDNNVNMACDTAMVYISCYILPHYRAPSAMDDDTIIAAGTTVIISVLNNDLALTGPIDTSSIIIYNPPDNGIATADTLTGEIIYQPLSSSYTGADTFFYQVCNAFAIDLCDTAMVSVQIVSKLPGSLSGSLTYANTGKHVLPGIWVKLKDDVGNLVASAITDSFGLYSFEGLDTGFYKVEASCNTLSGGFNATDAMLSLQHFAQMITLPAIAEKAADVDANNFINSGDAWMIASRFTLPVTTFPAGEWVFEKNEIYIPKSGVKLINNIKGLCYGDVNGSFMPSTKHAFSDLNLLAVQTINNIKEFTIPIHINKTVEAGAISLVFDYPGDLLKITGIQFGDDKTAEMYINDNGDKLRISWFSIHPVQLNPFSPVLWISMKPVTYNANGREVLFHISGESEIANEMGKPVQGIEYSMPKLVFSSADIILDAYPNPFRDITNIIFKLPAKEIVSLGVFNILGEEVMILLNNTETEAGEHEVEISGIELVPGIYTYRLVVGEGEEQRVFVDKLILTE